MQHEIFVLVCKCTHTCSNICRALHCYINVACILWLQPAQLCACPGPCDLHVCPLLWHSRGRGLHEGPSRWTPEKVLQTAHKGAAGLWKVMENIFPWEWQVRFYWDECIIGLSYMSLVCSPLLLQGTEVFPERRADLIQQVNKRVAKDFGHGRFRVEVEGSWPGGVSRLNPGMILQTSSHKCH